MKAEKLIVAVKKSACAFLNKDANNILLPIKKEKQMSFAHLLLFFINLYISFVKRTYHFLIL